MRTLVDLVRKEDGLVRTERALLTGTFVMGFLIVLLLLGVDIAGWFGIEPSAPEQ